MEEDEELQLLSETEPCVRYTGTSNYRLMSRFDLSGSMESGDPLEQITWTPGSEVPWATWLDYAGSEEQALVVFRRHDFEFELVGPGHEEILAGSVGEEEFSIGGSVVEE